MPMLAGVEDLTNISKSDPTDRRQDPSQDPQGQPSALTVLRGFRQDFYTALTSRADALFDLTDALLCAEGSVKTLVGLSLAPEHRRGHGALYDALNAGAVDTDQLRTVLARLPLPRVGTRITLAVDASPWLRPDAATAPERSFCHVYGRGRGADQRIPGWAYQFVVALGSGATSWTAPLDVVRLHPDSDATATTAAQLRGVVERLITAGHWHQGDAAMVVVMDSGYDVTRLAFELGDLPLVLIGRVRADRVFLNEVSARVPGAVGRPRRHGTPVHLADPATWPSPSTTSATTSARYGRVQVTSFDRLHPRLARRGPWAGHKGDLPVVAGTVVRVSVDHLPGARTTTSTSTTATTTATTTTTTATAAAAAAAAAAQDEEEEKEQVKPVWLWTSSPASAIGEVTTAWSAYLRRFDEEHTFRFFKQVLGWTCPQVRDPGAAERWTWLVIAAYVQLRLARPLTEDLRRPWERPAGPERVLTPARVRRGFRYVRAKTGTPARAPKPTRPGPGRPPGVKNRCRAPVQPVGKQPDAPRSPVTTG